MASTRLKVGITGSSGYIGTFLTLTLNLSSDKYTVSTLPDAHFYETDQLDKFVSTNDVIVHLAAMNRSDDLDLLYQTNVDLVTRLIAALDRTNSRPHVIMSSSIQEGLNNLYGRSKLEGRKLLSEWSARSGARFTGLVIPHIFGPYARPFYNSAVATFSHQIVNNLSPKINPEAKVQLLYVQDLIDYIESILDDSIDCDDPNRTLIPHLKEMLVTEVYDKLSSVYHSILSDTIFEEAIDYFTLCCVNTVRSYIPGAYRLPGKRLSENMTRDGQRDKWQHYPPCSYMNLQPGEKTGKKFTVRGFERVEMISEGLSIETENYFNPNLLSLNVKETAGAYFEPLPWEAYTITNVGHGPASISFRTITFNTLIRL